MVFKFLNCLDSRELDWMQCVKSGDCSVWGEGVIDLGDYIYFLHRSVGRLILGIFLG